MISPVAVVLYCEFLSDPPEFETEDLLVASYLRKRSRRRAGRAGAAAAAATCPCRGEGDGRRRACEKAARRENFQPASAFLLFQKRPASCSQKQGRILPSTVSQIQPSFMWVNCATERDRERKRHSKIELITHPVTCRALYSVYLYYNCCSDG